MTGNVQQFEPAPRHQASSGNGGDGKDLHGRVSSLEAHLQHLATKEDIRRLETLIAQRETAMLRWLIGIVSATGLALVTALLRLFIG